MDEDKKMCPICQKKVDSFSAEVCHEAKEYIMKRIKDDHPEWVEKDGLCPKCMDYYEKL